VVRTGQSCLADAGRRVRAALPPSLQAAFAAALAWLITRRVLGHTEPFFAPVAATISLGTMRVQRSQRIVQMVLGVLVGIGIGTLFGSLLGVSTPVLGLTVLAALLAGRALGAGFVGDGMMLVNQAASSAILVVTLHHGGTGAERAIDAAVGGAVALLVGVVLFPARPLPLLHAAERALLGALARALEGVASHLSAGTAAEPAWTLQTAHDVHDRLAGLTAARSFARVNVRVAPRRWRLRPLVDAEDRRLAQLHLLADAALALVRAATAALEDGQRLPSSLGRHIAALATAMGRLASARAPWPPELLGTVEEVTRRAIAEQSADRPDWPPVVASTLRTTARDLQEVTAQPVGPATTVPKGTRAAGRRRQHVAVRPRAQPEGGPPSAQAFAPHQARRYRRER
jgi:uncharacterized membrane protein YgaE (UPF0421/DUF939 family)